MKIPFKFKSTDEAYRQISLALNGADDGHTTNNGSFTCTPSAGSTQVTDHKCHAGSTIVTMPKTANSAVEIATLYLTPAKGSFTVHHANNAQTDRNFNYIIVG